MSPGAFLKVVINRVTAAVDPLILFLFAVRRKVPAPSMTMRMHNMKNLAARMTGSGDADSAVRLVRWQIALAIAAIPLSLLFAWGFLHPMLCARVSTRNAGALDEVGMRFHPLLICTLTAIAFLPGRRSMAGSGGQATSGAAFGDSYAVAAPSDAGVW